MTTTDESRTPVLVGVGARCQREDNNPARAREPAGLMIEALERAADDAGNRSLLARADRIYVPRGLWHYPDPGRLVADAIGASRARTVLAQIGLLQTTLFGRAADAIAAGEAQVVLVTGGEARHRELRAQILGCDAPVTQQSDGTAPDELLLPSDDVLHPLEIERGLVTPVSQFAMIENALRFVDGLAIEEHRRSVAELWAGFSRVAASNPVAWNPEARAADDIAVPSGRNRMLAFPYTKLHSSSWNVDQAAGLVFCSAAMAREMGVPEDRWIFPVAVVESNHMLPLCERRLVHRNPGFACVGRRIMERTGIAPSDIDHMDLYSCFPAAVQLQLRELGIPADRELTVTGGMAFAGGPLNNYVFQALVRMAQILRESPGTTGLVTAISGIINKQGASLWASQRPALSFVHEDVADEVAGATPRIAIVADRRGKGTVATYTVVYEGGEPQTGVALVDFSETERTIATSRDPAVVREMLESEFCGRRVLVGPRAQLLQLPR